MPTKTKVKHRVTFAPDTKSETEQLDCLVRAIEFKGPGIDELSNMIQNIHVGYSSNNSKRKPSFDSSSIIEQLRNTLDNMLDSEMAETIIKSNVSDNGSSVEDVNSPTKEDSTSKTLPTIEENSIKEFKTNHDSGISDIEFDIEKIKRHEVSPQARRRVSGLINKLDTCITELQRVSDTIDEETASEVQAASLTSIDEKEISGREGKEALPPRNGKPTQLFIDTNITNANTNVNNGDTTTGNTLYSEPDSASAGYYTAQTTDYIYQGQEIEDYRLNSTPEMTRFDLIRKGIYAIPNQPTVIEACYSGFLLSSILTVVAEDCSVLYFGILTENNLYFYNSTDENEPMFGRIIIDQNTRVIPIPTTDPNQGYLIEINGVYVMPDNQVINSQVRIMFSNKQERNIWYKVIRTTVNDWKIKASYLNNKNPPSGGKKRRLSFLSSVQLQPVYLKNPPKRSDSLHRNDNNLKPATKKPSELSDATLVSPDSADTITPPTTEKVNDQTSTASTPTSATTIASEENYGGVNPSQSILSALHVLEALERKRNNQELKK